MAKLSEEEMEQGRTYIRDQDLEGFMQWAKNTRVIIDLDLVREAISKCLQAGDATKAIRMMEAGFANADPTRDIIVGVAKLAFITLLLLGCIGGLIYLFK